MARLPDFFLAGAPKAGTTALWRFLDAHPEVWMSPVKEPNYFALEVREENFEAGLRRRMERERRSLRKYLDAPMLGMRAGGIVREWEDYLRLFAGAGDKKAAGEASVCYLWSATAAERIWETIPRAKILILLRDPAERAFSEYLQGVSNGTIRWSLREQIERNLRDKSGKISVHFPFLELGLYAGQVTRYVERFGKNVWIGFYDDFRERPAEVFAEICRFVGVKDDVPADFTRRYNEAEAPRFAGMGWMKRSGVWARAARLVPPKVRPVVRKALTRRPGTARMEARDRAVLVDFYTEDIRKLEGIVGRSLEAWLRVE
jgi:hypothetical protein